MAEAPQTITAEKLCALTGLTDRRHRQLATEGWFPAPIESAYLLTPTINGLFRYYRESNQRTKLKTADLKDEKLKKETRLLDLKIAREEGEMIGVGEVGDLLLHLSSFIKTVLYQRLGKEFGAKGAGRGAAELNAMGNDIADEICNTLRETIEKWEDEKTISQPTGAQD